MKKLIAVIRDCLAFLLGYTVRVYWNGIRREHYAFTFEGMLDCLSLYPPDAFCIVSYVGNYVVITRGEQNHAI